MLFCIHRSATGIPPYTDLAKRLSNLERAVESLPKVILAGCSKLMDEKGVASGNITKSYLEELIIRLLDERDSRNRGVVAVVEPVVSPARDRDR